MTSEEALIAYRKVLVDALVNSEGYRKAKAFGTFERFVQSDASATITPERYIQKGTAYTSSLDVGFKHTSPVDAIYDWLGLRKYGFKYSNDKERRSLAWAIVTNQKKDGGSFKRRNTSARTDIVQGAIDKTRPTLLKLVAGAYVAEVMSPVSDKIKQINAENRG